MAGERIIILPILLYYILHLFVFSKAEVNEQKISYDGYAVWKATPNDENGLKYLHNLFVNGSRNLKLDFWHPPSRVGHAVDIMVGPQSLSSFKLECQTRNITFNSFIKDVQKLIDQEKRPISSSNSKRKQFRDSRSFDFSQYPTWDTIEKYIKNLPNQYPNLVTYQELPQSTHEKRKLYVVTITNKSTASNLKPAIWIDGGIHAREWIAPVTTIYIMNRLLTNYNTDPNMRKYVDKLTWYFMPVMNPDGYAYTRVDRMWRKNRRPCTNSGFSSFRPCCAGVDLNRNFGFHWAESGSSSDRCSEVYQGPGPFSEPESQAVRDFILANKNIKAYLTLHSYSLMWIYPYGYKPNTYTADKNDLVNLAKKATKALQNEYGTLYTIGTAPDILYSAAGGSDDWVKGVANVKFVYTLELRPADYGSNNGFILSPSEITPTGEETWAGVKVIADEILANYSSGEKTDVSTTVEGEVTDDDDDEITTTLPLSNFCTDESNWCKYWILFDRCRVQEVAAQCKKACNIC